MGMERAEIDAVILWCLERSDAHRAVEAFVTGRHIDLLVSTPRQDGSVVRTPTARLRYVAQRRSWRLQWRDSAGSFSDYAPLPPSGLAAILDFLDADREPLFWPPDGPALGRPAG